MPIWSEEQLVKAQAMLDQKTKERGRPLTEDERMENLKRAFAENDIPGPWQPK